MSAILTDILAAIKTDIQDLNLTGLADDHVIVQKVASTEDKDLPATKYPCVLIAPYGAEEVLPYANTKDLVIYPIRVGMLAKEALATETATSRQTQNFDQYLQWRESIRKSFHNQHLGSGGATAFKVEVRPITITDRSAWTQRSLFVGELELRCHSHETRG